MLNDILLFVAVGFAAQMVDGTLGMAYGLTATTVLLSSGTSPATASASVHTAEIFTTGASGAAHSRMGNVDRGLIAQMVLPGMVGAFTGACVLATVPGDGIRPLVAVYLLLAGGVVLCRGLRQPPPTLALANSLRSGPLRGMSFVGGFLDAIGGGGWGAMMTTYLIWSGVVPRTAIGTVSLSEFGVTIVVSAVLGFTIGLTLWPVILGLVIGGVIAAPFAAYAVRHVPDRPMMVLVGSLIVILSLRQIISTLKL